MEDIHGGGCKEFRVFGPPGTGKTTWLVKQVRRAAEKYGGEKVLCCSFTKTAATEMVNRITPPDEEPLIPDSSVGTLSATGRSVPQRWPRRKSASGMPSILTLGSPKRARRG